MIVEHSFVTTIEEPQAMEQATNFLRMLGFRPAGENSRRSWWRPRRSRLQRGLPSDFIPREVKIEYDRGRVTAAIGIEPRGKPRKLHQDLLLAVVSGLEKLLAGQAAPEQAAADWQAIVTRRRRVVFWTQVVFVALVLAFGAGVIALALAK
jgi:hypothetical protein